MLNMKMIPVLLMILMVGCSQQQVQTTPDQIPEVEAPVETGTETPPVAQTEIAGNWKKPEWSAMVGAALDKYGAGILSAKPNDAAEYCPNFAKLNTQQKREFYIYLVSCMAEFESSFNPKATYTEKFADRNGVRVVSRGLLQISQESANGSSYKCGITDAQQLHDPKTNLTCGVKILARWIPSDAYIGHTTSEKDHLGGGRYWSVLRGISPSQAKIKAKTKAYHLCK